MQRLHIKDCADPQLLEDLGNLYTQNLWHGEKEGLVVKSGKDWLDLYVMPSGDEE